MARDLTMIFSVAISVLSLSFGVYKNIEAGNAKSFVYEQAYRVIGAVNGANIGSTAKASIVDAALGTLGTPPPVIDLNRSSADDPAPGPVCREFLVTSCINTAAQLAVLNASCLRAKGAGADCAYAAELKLNIDGMGCMSCFTR